MKRKDNMPDWAYWGLWGINSRKVAMAFLMLSVVITLALVPIGFITKDYFLASILLVPVWYWVSIKWADDHQAWSD